MRWAAGLHVPGFPDNEHPADIINLSLGSTLFDDQTHELLACSPETSGRWIDVINEVRRAGTVVVASAGNGEKLDKQGRVCSEEEPGVCEEQPIDVKYANPGGCPGVISVAASDRHGHIAPYSNYGDVTIMAPGGDVFDGAVMSVNSDGEKVLVLGDIVDSNSRILMQGRPYGAILSAVSGSAEKQDYSYAWYNGTSQAAPHVAGAIALMLAAHPELRHRPDEIEKALRASVAPLPPGACGNSPCGPGLLDAALLVGPLRAAAPALPPPLPPPLPTLSPVTSDCAGKVLLSDQFRLIDDNWDSEPDIVSVEDGKVKIKVSDRAYSFLYNGEQFDDADYCVTVQNPKDLRRPIDNSVLAGLLFWSEDRSNSCSLSISPDGYAKIGRQVRGQWSSPVAWRVFDAVNQGEGAKNRLRVSTSGNLITAYINGVKFASLRGHLPDGGGTVGLFAQSEKARSDTWKFLDLVVSDPKQQQP
jgi:subtilisin family serine protease